MQRLVIILIFAARCNKKIYFAWRISNFESLLFSYLIFHDPHSAICIPQATFNGAPGVSRTRDLWLRRPTLYPAELRARLKLAGRWTRIRLSSLVSRPSFFPFRYPGAPGRSRTCDLRIRSPTLYPAELRARQKHLIKAVETADMTVSTIEKWGERRGLNPRPPGPQPGALPTELRPP